MGSMRLRNVRQDVAVRYALLGADGGVGTRGAVSPGDERHLVGVPAGELRLLEWRRGPEGAQEATAHPHDVVLAGGSEVSVELGR